MQHKMGFSYSDYANMLVSLKNNNYSIANYQNWNKQARPVILRHDVDNSLEKAAQFALMEKELKAESTYFVLVTSDFYNLFSRTSQKWLEQILMSGHTIGLHFDEVRYPEIVGKTERICEKVQCEAELLSQITGVPVTCVSMHRPSPQLLQANLDIPGLINSYCDTFFKDFKYLSDSRHNWREPVLDVIASKQYKKLHILTHPGGYSKQNLSLEQWAEAFLKEATSDRWKMLNENMRNFSDIIPYENYPNF